MVYDLHAYRCKSMLFALDYNVGLPTVNAAEQRLPVSAVHRHDQLPDSHHL
jgi:hypothetical protein